MIKNKQLGSFLFLEILQKDIKTRLLSNVF